MAAIGALYRDALKIALGSEDASCRCFDYTSDFEELWGDASLAGDQSGPNPAKLPIIVVWDGSLPKGTEGDRYAQLLARHLTPLDWALAYSLRVFKESSTGSGASLSISIIDLPAGVFIEAWAVQMRHQLLADMPWVRLFAPDVRNWSPPFQVHRPVLVPDGGGEFDLLRCDGDTGVWRISSTMTLSW